MEKDAPKVQNTTNLKMCPVSTLKTGTGGTCKLKKEENTIPSKEVVSDKGSVTSEAKMLSKQLKSNNTELLNIDNTQKQNTVDDASPTNLAKISVKVPVLENNEPQKSSKVAVPRMHPPLPEPVLGIRPLVLAVHLVPSLPITLFEYLAEAIEAATAKPVVLLHESRPNRPVAKEVTDIAILPASGDWIDGVLLPASFVFEHRLNKEFQPHVYGDVVLATDRAPHVDNIMDLRGYRCALPDRRNSIGSAKLLFNYLQSKGEGPSFFGSILDVNSQLAALQMITGKQVEVGILESPVIKYHRNFLPGVETLSILSSLGPLPPYRIMVHKDMPASLVNKITSYLLKINQDVEWMEKLSPYSVLGFAENTKLYYETDEIKSVATSGPYY